MWWGSVQPAGNPGRESPVVGTLVWECGSWDLPLSTMLRSKTQVKTRHLLLARITQKMLWQVKCFAHLICVQKAKPLVPVPADQQLQVHGLPRSLPPHHIKEMLSSPGIFVNRNQTCFSTTAELCVSEQLPLVLLAISWPGKDISVGFGGVICHGAPLPHPSIEDVWHREWEEPWGHGALGA